MRISKPQGDLRSFVWKARTKTARRLLSGSPDEYDGDDFDWSRYHLEYSEQLSELEAANTLRLEDGYWQLTNGSLRVDRGLPLHPNHKILYETIAALAPGSVLEAGCGGGDHLYNLSLLLPQAEIRGIDRSEGQLGVLRRRNPGFSGSVSAVDLTLPHPRTIAPADVVFAQAVLMHIQTGNGHRVALWNVFDLALDQVVLMENLERHDLIRDISELWASNILPWESLHLYQAPAADGPPIIVASKIPVDLGMEAVPLRS